MSWVTEFLKKNWMSKIIKHINLLFIASILFTALVLNLLRIYLPGTFTNQKAYFEQWASNTMHISVKIENIQVEWHHFSPMIAFNNVTFLTKDAKPLVDIQELDIVINLFDSLLNWKLLPGMVILNGANLELNQSADAQFNLDDISRSSSKNLLKQTLSIDETLTWLLTQGTLIIQNVSIIWQRPDGSVMPINDVNLQVTQKDFKRSIVGNANLANDLAQRVVFSATLKNLDIKKLHFDSDVYLSLNQMQLASWTKLPFISTYLAKYQVLQGEANVQFWMQWHKMRLRVIQAQLNAKKLIVQTPGAQEKLVIGDLAANGAWEQVKGGWKLSADHVRAHINDEEWLDNSIGFQNFDATADHPAYQLLGLKFLRLYDLRLILARIPDLAQTAKQIYADINPQGTLKNLVIEHDGSDAWAAESVKLSSEFSELHAQAWKTWPGVSHLSGSLYWSSEVTYLNLNSKNFMLTWPYVFSEPLKLAKLQLVMRYVAKMGQWTANLDSFLLDDKNVLLKGEANFRHRDSGDTFSINSKFKIDDLLRITPYLPESIMDKDLYLWLSRSFKAGSISSGSLIFEGDPKDFPFNNGEGHFQVMGSLKDIDLQFDPAWPAVEKINGQLFFDNFLMHIDQASAVIAGNPVTRISAAIPNLMDALLLVEGHVDSNLKQALNFLKNSPIELGRQMQVLKMSGPMSLDLKLHIPLNKFAAEKFKFETIGDLVVKDATVDLLPLGLQLENFQGNFSFTENGLVAPKVSANLYSNPIDISIDTLTTKSGDHIAKFDLMGRLDMDHLQNKLHRNWLDFFHGSAVYQAQYSMYLSDTTAPNIFTLESNLQGISIDIPNLYTKDASQVVRLEGSAEVYPEGKSSSVGARYGDQLSLQLSFARHDNEVKLASGEIAIGSLAKQQTSSGLLVSLNFPSVNWEDWQKLIQEYSSLFSGQSSVAPDFLRSIHLKTGSLELYNHQLSNVDLQLQPGKAEWNATISSTNLAGNLILPKDLKNSAIQANLQHLYFSLNDKPSSNEMDFSTWPALNLSVDDLRYSDRPLGSVILSIAPILHGIAINKLQLTSADYNLFLSGNSVELDNNYKTDISGQVNSNNFGALLTNLHLTTALSGAKGLVDFSLHWLGSLTNPQISSISGFVDLNLNNGVIVNLDSSTLSSIGFARLLNLFSLQILPSLSQLSKKGFDFSVMKAHFDLKNANATMTNAMVDGSIAKVIVNGRIGYVAEDYDVVMTVQPYVTSSLPAIAGLAMANPIVGLLGWVVNKVVISPAISHAVQFKYQITGPWQKPTVVELEKTKVK